MAISRDIDKMKREAETQKAINQSRRELANSIETAKFQHDLSRENTERALLSSDRANEISERANNIAERALRSSELATRIAIIAIIFSITMAIKEIIEWYSK
jgi:uncharacterized protein (DUF3084 family)